MRSASARVGSMLLVPCTLTLLLGTAVSPGGLARAQSTATGPCSPEIERRIASAVTAQNYNEALTVVDSLERNAIANFGEKSRCNAAALSERATILQLLDRNVEAQPLFEKAIESLRQTTGAQDPKFSLALSNYGVNLYWLRRYKEAARVHEEALDLRRKLVPTDPAAVADSLHNLADAYRYITPEDWKIKQLYEDALKIKLSLAEPDDVSIAYTRQNLASMQENIGQLSEASDNLAQALSAYRQHLKADDTRIASVLNRQAIILFQQGNYGSAERKFEEAIRLERGNAKTQPKTVAATLDDFAINEVQLGKLPRANTLAQEALSIRRRMFPEDHPTIARTLSNLSYIAWLSRSYDKALPLAREASRITSASGPVDSAGKFRLQRHVLVLWSKLSEGGANGSEGLAEEAFLVGQQAIRSETAATLARTALRFSEREPRLRDLLREVDNIDRLSTALEQTISHSFTLASSDPDDNFSKLRTEMSALAARRQMTTAEVERSFPDYARLVNPKPMTAASVQKLLQPSEALIAYVVGVQDVFVWCVTQEALVFRKLDITPQQIKRAVDKLHPSLDRDPEVDRTAPLFDLGLANDLYNQLVGSIAAQIKSKSRLIIVPSGPLIGLPLHLLVSRRPKVPQPTRSQPEAYKTADWMIRKYAISEIPAVESLERLRRRVLPTANRKPLIGFANPLPSPNFRAPGEDRAALTSSNKTRGVKVSRGLPTSIRGANDIADLRAFLASAILWDSEPELREVASVVGAAEEDLFIGRRATEAALKTADLAAYRVVYFATHGQIANK